MFKPRDLVQLKSYPGALARIIEIFDKPLGGSRPYAEIEFIQNNPFQAKRHRVYVSELRSPPPGFVAAVDAPLPMEG